MIELNPRDIDLGERAGRDPGDLTDLMESLDSAGMAHPVTVSPGYRLVTGRRRLEACRKLGCPVPAEVITTVAEALEHLVRENADGRCAKPMSLIETLGLDAAMRELQWWPRQPPGHGDGGSNEGRHNGDLAVALGFNAGQYRCAREIFAAARGYREAFGRRHPVDGQVRQHAAAALPSMTSPPAIAAAYRRFKTGVPDLGSRSRRRSAADGRHERAIESAVAALTGLAAGFASAMPLDPDAVAGNAARWDTEVTKAIRALVAFRKQIREYR